MSKITQKKFLEILKKDKDLNSKFTDYLGDTKDGKEVDKKIIEFAKKEGYEIETKQTLDMDDMENISGGASFTRIWRCTNCNFHDTTVFWTKTSLKECPDCGSPLEEWT